MRTRILIQLACLTTIFSTLFLICQLNYVPNHVTQTTTENYFIASSFAYQQKHTTKSLSQLGKMDEINRYVLLLNAIPQSGSEILVVLLDWLQGWNNFRHVRLKNNKKKLSKLEQEVFVNNIHNRIRNEAVPISFEQSTYFINFTTFDRQSPTFINLIRDPADYLISRFHQIVADNSTMKNTTDIEKCILQRRMKCVMHKDEMYDLAIPYFCGQDPRCMMFNNQWALYNAKRNVDKYYSVVGILEEVNTTLAVLEKRLPYFFKGVQKLYYRDLLLPYHMQRGKIHKLSDKLHNYLRIVLKEEYQFYEWIKSRLFEQLQMT